MCLDLACCKHCRGAHERCMEPLERYKEFRDIKDIWQINQDANLTGCHWEFSNENGLNNWRGRGNISSMRRVLKNALPSNFFKPLFGGEGGGALLVCKKKKKWQSRSECEYMKTSLKSKFLNKCGRGVQKQRETWKKVTAGCDGGAKCKPESGCTFSWTPSWNAAAAAQDVSISTASVLLTSTSFHFYIPKQKAALSLSFSLYVVFHFFLVSSQLYTISWWVQTLQTNKLHI